MSGPTRRPIRRLPGLYNLSVGRRGTKKKAAPPRAQLEESKCCDDPKIEEEDGHKICKNCYTEIAESNIVADVTFEEDSRGAHTVQGGFIGDNARHAKTLGAAARRLGGDQPNRHEEIRANFRRASSALCQRLGISDNAASQASQLFIIASQHRFASGRSTDEVVAACLYAACRRQKENTVMLIDIAEVIQINVFRLGEVYKDMCNKLYLEEANGAGASSVGRQYLVEVESLIMKYCRKLEFGEATRQVAEDAIKIVKRMKRDWMVTGRHPAGLCGACIILAARMNNFRRTTREVVLVAKVADHTLAKRVEEFRRTKAAALTVDQFREFGVRLKGQSDPPILYERDLRKGKSGAKKRKRVEEPLSRENNVNANAVERGSSQSLVADTGSKSAVPNSKRLKTNTGQLATPRSTESASEGMEEGSDITTQQSPPQSQHVPGDESMGRYDADGFRIPALPEHVSSQSDGQNDLPGRARGSRGRKGKQALLPIIITDEELATEEELQKEIVEVLDDDQLIESRDEVQQARDEQRAKDLATKQKELSAQATQLRRQNEGITWVQNNANEDEELVSAADLEREFADDPEVINCLLSPAEQEVKERIWVTYNEDWLRVQHEKRLLAEIARANPPVGNRRGAKGGKKPKKGRMGDGTLLANATTPIETATDAVMLMLKERTSASFSKSLDYNVLNSIYGRSSRRSNVSPGRDDATTPSDSSGDLPVPQTGDSIDGAAMTMTDSREDPKAVDTLKTQDKQGTNENDVTSPPHGDDEEGDDEPSDDDRQPRNWFSSSYNRGDNDDEDGDDDYDYERAVDLANGRYTDFEQQFDDEDEDEGY